MKTRMLWLVMASGALSACDGNGEAYGLGPGPIFCETISGGATQISSNAGVSNPFAAIDGDFGSYAVLESTRTANASLRAIAQAGVVFPAGNRAGFFADEPFDIAVYEISTYLDGALQEAVVAGEDAAFATQQFVFYGFTTLRPFDAVGVELRFLQPGSSNVTRTRTLPQFVYEFCSNAAP